MDITLKEHVRRCVIKMCAYETPFQTTFTLKFDGGQVMLASDANVAIGPSQCPQMYGKME